MGANISLSEVKTLDLHISCLNFRLSSTCASPQGHPFQAPTCLQELCHCWVPHMGSRYLCGFSLCSFHHLASANTLCLIFIVDSFSVPDGLLSASSLEFYGFLSVASPTSDFSCILEPAGDSVFLPTSSQMEGSCRLLPIQA